MNTDKTKNILFKAALSFILLLSVSCSNDDEGPDQNQDCGCASETLLTIPNSDLQVPIDEQKTGFIFYKHPELIDGFYDDDIYNNRFWIFQGTEGCYNCQRNFIVCNESILDNQFDYLKQQNNYDSIQVKFSGGLKSPCILRAVLGDYFYAEIVLDSIQ